MRFWRYLNILSIDIALGAMAGCAFFASILHVTLRPQAYLSLGMVVWMIYTVDHLLDASRDIKSLSTERHRFHREHRRWLTYLVVAVALMVMVQTFLVRIPVLVSGLVVGGFVALYILLQRFLGFLKEIAGALLYTAGIVIAPATLSEQPLTVTTWVLVIIFCLTAYVNLMICSRYDIAIDLADKHRSFTTQFGVPATNKVIAVSLGIILLLMIVSLFRTDANLGALTLLAFMNGLLVMVLTMRGYFGLADRHRLFADLAFILPLLYLIFDGA